MNRERTFVTKGFDRFAKKHRLTDPDLLAERDRLLAGLIDADLGGGLYKQRMRRPDAGRSGGYRLLIALRIGDRLVFLTGFAKNDQPNLAPEEIRALKERLTEIFALEGQSLDQAVSLGILRELRS